MNKLCAFCKLCVVGATAGAVVMNGPNEVVVCGPPKANKGLEPILELSACTGSPKLLKPSVGRSLVLTSGFVVLWPNEKFAFGPFVADLTIVLSSSVTFVVVLDVDGIESVTSFVVG